MTSPLAIITRFQNLGYSPKMSQDLSIKLRLINTICITAITIWLLDKILVDIRQQLYYEALITSPLAIAFSLPLVANKYGKVNIAGKLLIILTSLVISYLYFSFGRLPFYELIFIVIFIVILHIESNKYTIAMLLAFVIICWYLPYRYHVQHPDSSSIPYSQPGTLIVIFASLILIYAISTTVVAQLNKYLRQQDKLIEKQTENLELLQRKNQSQKLKEQRLKEKNKEIELFFLLCSELLSRPTQELIQQSKSLQFALSSNPNEEAKNYINIVHNSSKRMGQLVDAVFDYAAIKENSPKNTVNCNDIINEIKLDLQHSIQSSNTKIFHNELPVLNANKIEIRMLFQNLISNSIKYSKTHQPTIISINASDIDDYWEFRFSDNGIGIDHKHQNNIFKMFHKLHSTDVYEGTGIGLSHCKKIVEMMGGKIWVESEPGLGASFFFTVPKTNQS